MRRVGKLGFVVWSTLAIAVITVLAMLFGGPEARFRASVEGDREEELNSPEALTLRPRGIAIAGKAASLSGTVRIDGRPTPSLSLRFVGSTADRNTFTGVDGAYELVTTARGSLAVTVRNSKRQVVFEGGCTLRDGNNQFDVDIRTGSVEFQVEQDGGPRGRWKAALVREPWVRRSYETDLEGFAVAANSVRRVDSIAPGRYRIVMWDSDHGFASIASPPFDIVSGRVTSGVSVVLRGGNPIEILVIGGAGMPERASVTVSGVDGGPDVPVHIVGKCSKSGGFRIEGLRRGTYRVECDSDGPYASVRTTIEVKDGVSSPQIFKIVR